MRKLLILLAVALCGLAAVASASAGIQKITPYQCPTSSGGFSSGTGPVVSAAESGGDPVVLRFGWAALKSTQLDNYLQYTNGYVQVGSAPSTSDVFSDAWLTGDPTGWSTPYSPATLQANANSPQYQGVATFRNEQIGYLSNPNPGTDVTYYLNMNWAITHTIMDGFGTYKPGSFITLTDCPITVHNYNTP